MNKWEQVPWETGREADGSSLVGWGKKMKLKGKTGARLSSSMRLK
jgi:hypothetical protein